MADMRYLLLLVAVWCWGMALASIVGITARIIFGVIGIAAFGWLKQIKPKETPAGRS
jgi:hypothetical protein